jgi:hypothetical protein
MRIIIFDAVDAEIMPALIAMKFRINIDALSALVTFFTHLLFFLSCFNFKLFSLVWHPPGMPLLPAPF